MTRCGTIAVLGASNVGKSTLINELVGSKVSIVSPKVQTTRTLVRGVAIDDDTQLVFIDTPGIFTPQRRLDKAMVNAAWQGLTDADAIMLVADATKKQPSDFTAAIIDRLAQHNEADVPVFLVLNKVDQVKKEDLLTMTARMNEAFDFAATFMVSALKGKGVPDILKALKKSMPENEWIFPEDEISDMPMRLLAAEITREKLFHKLYQELPYDLTVETEEWEEFRDCSIKISQIVTVTRDGQKKIVLGKGGAQIKAVGESARQELADILETPVHLKLFVKVREQWAEDPEVFKLWGLDFRA